MSDKDLEVQKPWKKLPRGFKSFADWVAHWDRMADHYGDPIELLFEASATGYMSYRNPAKAGKTSITYAQVTPKERIAAAKVLTGYRYPQLKAVELNLSNPVEEEHLLALERAGPNALKAAALALREERAKVLEASKSKANSTNVIELSRDEIARRS